MSEMRISGEMKGEPRPQSKETEVPFDELAKANRSEIKKIAEVVWRMRHHKVFTMRDPSRLESLKETTDRSEMKENVILAYRHLEDAAMRLGKAIQAYDGGTSVYDK